MTPTGFYVQSQIPPLSLSLPPIPPCHFLKANLAVQLNRLATANVDLQKAQAELDAKQAELDVVQGEYEKAMMEKQVNRFNPTSLK